ncbi:myb-like protein Q [Homalodisca vitripennis]|uniref:myb-like protein Q n=1 Tax=Homalodisca vitripennis TaxID=197043 RepID=UPI001EEBC4C9|nr:myb-like protein Q [Homalodisca vitripennis]
MMEGCTETWMSKGATAGKAEGVRLTASVLLAIVAFTHGYTMYQNVPKPSQSPETRYGQRVAIVPRSKQSEENHSSGGNAGQHKHSGNNQPIDHRLTLFRTFGQTHVQPQTQESQIVQNHVQAQPTHVHTRTLDYHDPHPKYKYEYAVHDSHTGDFKSHHEERDGDTVHGSYELIEPGGARRVVHYTSGKNSGFVAVVHREHTVHERPVQQESAHQEPVYPNDVYHEEMQHDELPIQDDAQYKNTLLSDHQAGQDHPHYPAQEVFSENQGHEGNIETQQSQQQYIQNEQMHQEVYPSYQEHQFNSIEQQNYQQMHQEMYPSHQELQSTSVEPQSHHQYSQHQQMQEEAQQELKSTTLDQQDYQKYPYRKYDNNIRQQYPTHQVDHHQRYSLPQYRHRESDRHKTDSSVQ